MYHALGKYGEAEGIQVKVLALQQEIVGDKHSSTIRSMADLAVIHRVRSVLKE